METEGSNNAAGPNSRRRRQDSERMSSSRIAISLITLVLIFSVLIPSLASLIAVEITEDPTQEIKNTFNIKKLQKVLKLNDDPKNLMVFLQVNLR